MSAHVEICVFDFALTGSAGNMHGTTIQAKSALASAIASIVSRKFKPKVPEGTRVYIVGDIHGRLDLLLDISARISADLLSRPVLESRFVFLGDYIDRGPDSAGVLSRLADMLDEPNVVLLRGNHEQILLNFLADPDILRDWRNHGGLETLQSYGVPVDDAIAGRGYAQARKALAERMPQAHLRLLKKTWHSCSIGDYFFCHAGIDPARGLDEQSPHDLMWTRKPFLDCDKPFGKIVVHGHTPLSDPEVRPNRINVDTGAHSTNVLTCLILEGDTRRFLSTRESGMLPADKVA